MALARIDRMFDDIRRHDGVDPVAVLRQPAQQRRQIVETVGDDVDDTLLVLQNAGHADQPRAHDDGAILLELARPDDGVGDAGLILEVMKMALPAPGRCRTRTRPPMVVRRPGKIEGSTSWRTMPRASKSQRRNDTGCAFSDEMQMAIVLDHLLARRASRADARPAQAPACRRARTAADCPCRQPSEAPSRPIVHRGD